MRTKGGGKMKKITRQIRFLPTIWEKVVKEAEKQGVAPNQWVISLVGDRVNGVLKPAYAVAQPVSHKKKPKKEMTVEERLEAEAIQKEKDREYIRRKTLAMDEEKRAQGIDPDQSPYLPSNMPYIREQQHMLEIARDNLRIAIENNPDDPNNPDILEFRADVEKYETELGKFIPDFAPCDTTDAYGRVMPKEGVEEEDEEEEAPDEVV